MSTIKVDTVRPVTTDGSLSLKGDSGGSATTNGISIDSSGNTSVSGQLNADNIRIDGNTISSTDTDGDITLDPNGAGIVSLDGAVTINESGADVDFRIESDTDTHALFVEGSSGNVFVGTTSTPSNSNLGIELQNNGVLHTATAGASTGCQRHIVSEGTLEQFKVGGAVVGSIYCTSVSTIYNTSSDYRLKEDVQPMSGSIDRLKALKPVNFAWKIDGSRVDGFLAHEAQEVVPEAVTGEKDAVDADGNPVYQGIDQAKLAPLLTAALQEAVIKIESLEARIATLEATPA